MMKLSTTCGRAQYVSEETPGFNRIYFCLVVNDLDLGDVPNPGCCTKRIILHNNVWSGVLPLAPFWCPRCPSTPGG